MPKIRAHPSRDPTPTSPPLSAGLAAGGTQHLSGGAGLCAAAALRVALLHRRAASAGRAVAHLPGAAQPCRWAWGGGGVMLCGSAGANPAAAQEALASGVMKGVTSYDLRDNPDYSEAMSDMLGFSVRPRSLVLPCATHAALSNSLAEAPVARPGRHARAATVAQEAANTSASNARRRGGRDSDVARHSVLMQGQVNTVY